MHALMQFHDWTLHVKQQVLQRYGMAANHLSLGYLGFLGSLRVLGRWKTVLYLGFRDVFHVLLLTAFKALTACVLDLPSFLMPDRQAEASYQNNQQLGCQSAEA